MREVDRIVDELTRAVDGDPWHGPSVQATLDGVDLTVANARPLPSAHTIGELVVHMTAWTREITRRLLSGVAQDPEDGDWPPANFTSEAQWQAAVSALMAANKELLTVIKTLNEEVLDERIGDARDRSLGSGVTRYVTLHGIAQHHAYHAGQISLLRAAHRSSGVTR